MPCQDMCAVLKHKHGGLAHERKVFSRFWKPPQSEGNCVPRLSTVSAIVAALSGGMYITPVSCPCSIATVEFAPDLTGLIGVQDAAMCLAEQLQSHSWIVMGHISKVLIQRRGAALSCL